MQTQDSTAVSRSLSLAVLVALALAGCGADPVFQVRPVPTPPVPTGTVDPPPECAQLSLSPETFAIAPRGLIQFVPAGGSGSYRFEVSPPELGTVDNATGGFVAGRESGLGTVVLTDANCEGTANATVEVVSGLRVSPEAARLAPGATLSPTWVGGSDQVTCSLLSGAGTVSGCVFTATFPGIDVLRVSDPVTGLFSDIRIQVEAGVTFQVVGHEGVVLPVGTSGSGRWVPRASSGSGVLQPTVVSGAFSVVGNGVEAVGFGGGTIRVDDVHTGDSVVVPIEALPARTPTLPRDGERSGQGVAIPLGDVDGDGYDDAAYGFIEPSLQAHYGGLVAVHRGSPSGLIRQPDQVFAGEADNQTLGRSLAAADVNQDGRVDLIMGADRADIGVTNNGLVRIHHGLADGSFDPVPRRLVGEIPFSRFGSAVAPCDFDGDGWIDLAVGAMEAADLATALPPDNQGAIQIFWGGPNGYSDGPDFSLFGALWDGVQWVETPLLELGTSLAAGDFDGDGLCDLASGTPAMGVDGDFEEGVVFVYEGLDDGSILSRRPVRMYAGPRGEASGFGRSISAADVDGDGRAELVVGAWQAGADGAGAAYIYQGPTVLAAADPIEVGAADLTITGAFAEDRFGTDVRLDDYDGDGQADIVVGAYRAQRLLSDQGRVFVFLDPPLTGLNVTSAQASGDFVGIEAGDRFGQAAAAIGDADGDGIGDLLGISGYSDTNGVEVGAPLFVSGSLGQATELELPGAPAGHEAGAALLRFDVDLDGIEDLIIGAPEAGVPTEGANAGALFWARGSDQGFGPMTTLLGGHRTHSGSDRFGNALASADFDGDGLQDLLVAARSDSRSEAFESPAWTDTEGCAGLRSLSGSVHVYLQTPTGLSTSPNFAWFGPEAYGYVERLIGGLDHDGDGKQDFVASSTFWGDSTGGYEVVRGRSYTGPGIEVICQDAPTLGNDLFDRLGVSLVTIGDLDEDGCDEFAVGATGEEFLPDYNNQGSVRVLWGWGAASCPAQPTVSTLQFEVVGTGVGSGLASGEDVDGDGLVDLVVSGAQYRIYFAEHGAVWFVPGSWVREQPRQVLPGGVLPGDLDTERSELLPNQGLGVRRFGLVGRDAAGGYGSGLALVPMADGVRVAVSAPLGAQGGLARTGGVELHRWTPDGFEVPASRLIVGEAVSEGLLGSVMVPGPSGLVVGAPDSSAEGLTLGAWYPVSF